ncbi:MAG TPA: DUF3108 domain-containing protein, partial [Kiritimatiellia bacterium]|nr:DUF3108 domain-containing protein [Kiritimatiellia bacterium]
MKPILAILAGLLLASFMSIPARAAGGERLEYDVTWVGVSVASMAIQSQTNEAGNTIRSLRIRNRPWLSLVYPVDTFIECEIEATSEGPRHTVRKTVSEREFKQNDTLVLWPDQRKAFWSNAVERTVHWSLVPKGSRDLVTFFFDLREVLAGSPLAAGGSYQLVMDGAVHDLDIKIGKPKTIRSAFGRLEAIPVDAISRSPTLFSRNRPKSVWVAIAKPSVLSADVETRFGPV